MTKPLKIAIIAASVLGSILVLAALAVPLLLDAESYRPRIQEAASSALGMDVDIGGPIRFRFLPGLLVTLEDVHVRNQGMDVGSTKSARLGLALLPLFSGQIQATSITLQQPTLSIERDLDGTFNFERDLDVIGVLPAFSLTRVTLVNGTLRYPDKQPEETLEARDCNLTLREMRLPGRQDPDPMQYLTFNAQLACGEIRHTWVKISDLQLSASHMDGTLRLEPVTMEVFGGQGSAHVRADFSGGMPRYDVHYSLSRTFTRDRKAAARSMRSYPTGASRAAWQKRRMLPWQRTRTGLRSKGNSISSTNSSSTRAWL